MTGSGERAAGAQTIIAAAARPPGCARHAQCGRWTARTKAVRASALLLVSWAWCFQAIAAPSEGERLAYVVGCINCHHQTPKEIINAPPLLIVRAYSPDQFRKLLRTGVTNSGRDLLAISSIMGIVAKEQFSHFTENEVRAIYTFLTREWTEQRAAEEEAKIPSLYRAKQQEPE